MALLAVDTAMEFKINRTILGITLHIMEHGETVMVV